VNIKQMLGNKEGNNFQDIARIKRYEWFERVRSENNYDFIAVAHHKNDNIETFLYKVSKGSGLKGLGGIKPKNMNVVRPLLFVLRNEIDEYVDKHNISFVHDSSNSGDDYDRNFIRHHIVPEFEKLHPNFTNRISVTIDNLKDVERQFDFLLEAYTAKYICRKKGRIIISKLILEKVENRASFMYFVLQKYGFNKAQVKDILSSVERVGAMFETKLFLLLVDRVSFIISKKNKDIKSEFLVYLGDNVLEGIGILKLEKIKNEDLVFNRDFKYLNLEKLQFPLKLRKWNAGDSFKPFGLKGKSKKLKDYFTNKKINRFDKDDILLLINKDDICMVLGYDISYDYAVNQDTKYVLKVTYKTD